MGWQEIFTPSGSNSKVRFQVSDALSKGRKINTEAVVYFFKD